MEEQNGTLYRLSQSIESMTEIHFPEKRWKDLEKYLFNTARTLKYSKETLYEKIVSSSLSEEEYDCLINNITVGETFFFRDRELFNLLKDKILKDIACKKAHLKRITIWSAGCCSGEEPYSIAILLDQMALFKGWDISITATDINRSFLKKAREGVYRKWSFRDTPSEIIEKYFTKKEKSYEISDKIKKMVNFQLLNLADKKKISQIIKPASVDLLFFRNVLIYFKPESKIIEDLYSCLADDGLLFLSPAETSLVKHRGLQIMRYPYVSLFKKTEKQSFCMTSITNDSKTDRKAEFKQNLRHGSKYLPENNEKSEEKPSDQEILMEAEKLYKEKSYHKCISLLYSLLEKNQNSRNIFLKPEIMALLSRVLADTGKHNEAKIWCEKAIEKEKLNPEYRYLKGTICEEMGLFDEALDSFSKAVFLDPEFIMANYHLFILSKKMHRMDLCNKFLKHTKELLKVIPPEKEIPHSDGLTAAGLSAFLKLSATT